MSLVIEKFYEENKIPPILLKQKLKRLEDNADISAEFEYWILNRLYKTEGAVNIEGYTAKKLAVEHEYLDGEGAFMMLLELRENPGKALDKIGAGFQMK